MITTHPLFILSYLVIIFIYLLFNPINHLLFILDDLSKFLSIIFLLKLLVGIIIHIYCFYHKIEK
jgi:hypothetical protein